MHAALVGWIVVAYVLCGLIAWTLRPDSRFGPLMAAAGFAPLVSTLAVSSADLPYTVGEALRLLPVVLFLHVFLAYPTGRLRGLLERVLVAAAYLVAIGFRLPTMLLGGSGSDNLLEVVHQPGSAAVVRWAQVIGISTVVLAAVGVLIARVRIAGRPLRRPRDLFAMSFVLALVLLAAGVVISNAGGSAKEPMRAVTFAVIGIPPLVFLGALLRSRLARSAAADLLVELRSDPAPAVLRDALARALRDPSLTLVYWLPEFESWADLEGRAVELPQPDEGRATILIDRAGVHVAALVHDPALDNEPELLAAVSAGAAIALENGRLHAELRARLVELRGSRARVIEAGQSERQRLERNLHDGAQQRLIALSLDLGLLEERLSHNPDATGRLREARHEIALSLAELRDVARGLHPAVVSGHGLAVALESLAARAPVHVRLRVDLDARLHEGLEVAAYYVVAESLTNVGKHAQAMSATVDITRVNGQVVVEVVDDGIGGADTERGSGLRGLADRIEALGGRLRVWTPRGGGTRVRAEIPCA
ncbi:MAG TPA: histidine kinase [Gaiellaceae bacterium]|nr:histidine kinase [Gaiellaceae bacterium]